MKFLPFKIITSKIISIFVIYFFIIWLTWKILRQKHATCLPKKPTLENHHNFGDAIVQQWNQQMMWQKFLTGWIGLCSQLVYYWQHKTPTKTTPYTKIKQGYAIKRDLPVDCSSLSLLNCLCRVWLVLEFIHSATSFEIFKFIR